MEKLDETKGKNGEYCDLWMSSTEIYQAIGADLGIGPSTFNHRMQKVIQSRLVPYKSALALRPYGRGRHWHTETKYMMSADLFKMLFAVNDSKQRDVGKQEGRIKPPVVMDIQKGLAGEYQEYWMKRTEIIRIFDYPESILEGNIARLLITNPDGIMSSYTNRACRLYRADAVFFQTMFPDGAVPENRGYMNLFLDMSPEEYKEYFDATPVGKTYNALADKVNCRICWTDQRDGKIRIGTLTSILPYTFRAHDEDGPHWEIIKLANPELMP